MSRVPILNKLENAATTSFEKPSKKIHDGADVSFFLTTLAYRDIVTFVMQLNRSVVPRKIEADGKQTIQRWPLGSLDVVFSQPVHNLRQLLASLEALIADAPPDPGPRRFGNVSFRTWTKLVEGKIKALFEQHFSPEVRLAHEELEGYLLGSFGSPQRLDYGTGHELSFMAFLGCLWKLKYFEDAGLGVEERGIVLGVFEPYLHLIRSLIKIYNLEPAGSHGVWGLDDNSFLPYVFGSAQLSPAITEVEDTPLEGSVLNAPDPSSVAKSSLVEKEKETNLYFSAVAFIYDVKKGPFWEHSPMLFDISGIKDGWGKINKGMIKMFNAEVLSKFPVVQHFPFGSLFKWERDPEAKAPPPSTHTTSQPLRNPTDSSAPTTIRPTGPPSTAAPWARPPPPPAGFVNGVTQAPWATQRPTATQPPRRGGFQAPLRGPLGRPPASAIPEESKLPETKS